MLRNQTDYYTFSHPNPLSPFVPALGQAKCSTSHLSLLQTWSNCATQHHGGQHPRRGSSSAPDETVRATVECAELYLGSIGKYSLPCARNIVLIRLSSHPSTQLTTIGMSSVYCTIPTSTVRQTHRAHTLQDQTAQVPQEDLPR